MSKPYVYILFDPITFQYYTGVKPVTKKGWKDELLISYKTSSEEVKTIIKEHPGRIQIIYVRELKDKIQASLFEEILLTIVQAHNNDSYYNKSIAGRKFASNKRKLEEPLLSEMKDIINRLIKSKHNLINKRK